jgi:hypothetical protein
MTSRRVRLLPLIAAVGFWSAALAPAWAEADDPKALAAALKDATATLQGGLKASEREGTPISAKFEIDDGKLQLSVYTMKGDGFTEVVADPKTGAIAEAEKITDADDLKAAESQKAAMSKAKVPLLTATEFITHPVGWIGDHQMRLDPAEHALDVRRDRAVAAEETMLPEEP